MNKIQLFLDLQDWVDYFLYKHICISVGSRIHGNIMSLLCGIPALICPLDERVNEMAEFFRIPTISKVELKKVDNVSSLVSDCNYDDFNSSFESKFLAYENFLVERDIVKSANENCVFFKVTEPCISRQESVQNMKNDNTKLINDVMSRKLLYRVYEMRKIFL